MKQDFLNFVNELMNANPDLTAKLMNDNVKAYLDVLKEVKVSGHYRFDSALISDELLLDKC